jgi:hypothetical protein
MSTKSETALITEANLVTRVRDTRDLLVRNHWYILLSISLLAHTDSVADSITISIYWRIIMNQLEKLKSDLTEVEKTIARVKSNPVILFAAVTWPPSIRALFELYLVRTLIQKEIEKYEKEHDVSRWEGEGGSI